MGALPDRLPGFQHVEDDELRAKFERAWGVADPAQARLAPVRDVRGHGARRADRPLRASARTRASPRPTSTAPCTCSRGSTSWSCRTSSSPRPPSWPTSCCPAAAGWCESEGTVTNSERRVQRVRRAVPPPAGARDDIEILFDLARRMGHDWGEPTPRSSGTSCARSQPDARRHELRAAGGARTGSSGPATTRTIRASSSSTAGSGSDPSTGRAAPFSASSTSRRSSGSPTSYPLRLTTGRRLDSYNTGVQTSRLSPRRCGGGETLDLSPEDAARLGSRRASGARHLAARRGRGAGALRPGPAAGARCS